jgi:hypothetical protein
MMISPYAFFRLGLFMLVLDWSAAFSANYVALKGRSNPSSIRNRKHFDFSESTTLFYRDDEQAGGAEPHASAACKEQLLALLNMVPSNAPTPRKLTKDILDKVEELETLCPTPDNEVIAKLAGVWELQWTAQDRTSDEWRKNPLRAYIK